MGSLVVLLLAERARYECAHSTRALKDQPGYPVKKNKRAWKDHLEGRGSLDARRKGQPRPLLVEDVWSRDRDGRASLEGLCQAVRKDSRYLFFLPSPTNFVRFTECTGAALSLAGLSHVTLLAFLGGNLPRVID